MTKNYLRQLRHGDSLTIENGGDALVLEANRVWLLRGIRGKVKEDGDGLRREVDLGGEKISIRATCRKGRLEIFFANLPSAVKIKVDSGRAVV